jgi:hypothetical protein
VAAIAATTAADSEAFLEIFTFPPNQYRRYRRRCEQRRA